MGSTLPSSGLDAHANPPSAAIPIHNAAASLLRITAKPLYGSTQMPSTTRVDRSPPGWGFWYSSVTYSTRARLPAA